MDLLTLLFDLLLVIVIMALVRYVARMRDEERERKEREKEHALWLEQQQAKEEAKRAFEQEQTAKGLVKFVDRRGKTMWGTAQQVEKWRGIDQALKNRFQNYTSREFEEFIADLFRHLGYEVELSRHVRDRGIDLLATKDGRRVAVQVKRYKPSALVGSAEVREVLGAVWGKAEKAVLVTTSDFTEEAYIRAQDAPIDLWNYGKLAEVIEEHLMGEVRLASTQPKTNRFEPKTISEQVLESLEGIRKAFDNPNIKEGFKGFRGDMQFKFIDLNVSYVLSITEDASATLREGTVEKPKIAIEVDSTTFLGMRNNTISGTQAYASGKLKVKGAMPDLRRLQNLMAG